MQVIQPGNDCLEAPFLREGSDMQLIDDHLLQGHARPTGVAPGIDMVHHLRWAVHTFGLKVGCRIRSQCAIVQPKEIGCTREKILALEAPVTQGISFSLNLSLFGPGDAESHTLGKGRPHSEPALSFSAVSGTDLHLLAPNKRYPDIPVKLISNVE